METIVWRGCYRKRWNSVGVTPDTYIHPAKVQVGLSETIYRFMIQRGYLGVGDSIIAPFGGVACFAFHALLFGMHWQGVEIEEKFVKTGRENIAAWELKYAGAFPSWGTAVLHLGDSRELLAVITEPANAVISSPPYSVRQLQGGGMASRGVMGRTAQAMTQNYGTTTGQLGSMQEGDLSSVLENNRRASFDACITSPPYANMIRDGREGPAATSNKERIRKRLDGTSNENAFKNWGVYGVTDGNMGNTSGPTFWEGANEIVHQVYEALRPGGMAVWVTGNFRHGGEIVDFGGEWLSLCESVGFKPVVHALALKTDRHGESINIFGERAAVGASYVSFFRRRDNAANPHAPIDHEDVWFLQKP